MTTYAIDWGNGRTTRVGSDKAYAEHLLREASGPFPAHLPAPRVIPTPEPLSAAEPEKEISMTTDTTPADFLASPVDPDEDAEQVVIPPLERIAQALQVIAGLEAPQPKVSEEPGLRDYIARQKTELAEVRSELAKLTEAFQVLDAAYADRGAQIAGVLAIIKPSVSKLANEVRAYLALPTEQPETDGIPEALSTGAAGVSVPLSNPGAAGSELATELPGQPHNHSFYEKSEDGTQLLCSCGYAIPA